jgi:hypothetical protein
MLLDGHLSVHMVEFFKTNIVIHHQPETFCANSPFYSIFFGPFGPLRVKLKHDLKKNPNS